jgi:ankyrin repeat protein
MTALIQNQDLDGSGKVRYTEFIAATIEAHGKISEARLAEAFDRLDCDDSGYITADNLIEILGENVPRDEIDAIIDEADLTKNGCVSYSEFMALWENEHELGLEDVKILQRQVSSVSSMDDSDYDGDVSFTEGVADEHECFLMEKNQQNTLHTWALEMQLPAQEFAKGCSFLHNVALGNESDVERIMEESPTMVNFRDYDRRTALHIAAAVGHVRICDYLIKKGARVNRADRWENNPIDDAHRHGHAEVVNLLRDIGAKFGSTSKTVNLITAASEGNVKEVKTLLEFGSIDLNQGDYDHRTALHLAANNGHLDVVKLLCKAGADVNVVDRFGDKPVDDARKAKNNATAIVNVLTGAPHAAVLSKEQQQQQQQKASRMDDLKDQTSKQRAPLQQDDCMSVLSVHEFAMGCSVLHQAALGNKLVLEKIFKEKPELVNFRDYDRRTPLHIASAEGQLDICKLLVSKGARINRCDRFGGTAMDEAYRHKYVEVVKFLREEGAKFGSTSQVTNFITAAAEGDVEEVQAFLEFGSIAIVNEGDYDNRTALALASCNGQLEIVKLLCEAGADVNVQDRWGNRPLDDAKNTKENSTKIMRLLMEHGAMSTKFPTIIITTLLKFSLKD